MSGEDIVGLVAAIAVLAYLVYALLAPERLDDRGELAAARGPSRGSSDLLTPLLGGYLARVYGGESAPGDRDLLPVERAFYRLFGVDANREQAWSVCSCRCSPSAPSR